MSTYLTPEILQGLDHARKTAAKKSTRLRVEFDGELYPVLRKWDGGFALDAQTAPHLRGLVDMFDGTKHVSQCLIVASDQENGEWKFEYKRNTAASDRAALDFVRPDGAPVALIGDLSGRDA